MMRVVRRLRPGRPRGTAPAELVLMLPLVLAMVSIILTGMVVGGTRLIVAHAVRRDAWVQLHGTPTTATLGLAAAATFDLGRLAGVPTDAGLVLCQRSRTTPVPSVPPMPPFSATLQFGVMGGTWDYQSIPFPPRPPLQSDPRFFVYAPGAPIVMPFAINAPPSRSVNGTTP